MAHLGNSITVLSANCQGLQNKEKRFDVINYFKETHASIVCLQDTHWTEKDIKAIKALWGNDIYLSGGQTNSRGVAILLNNNFEYEVLNYKKDKNGNFLNLILKLSTMIVNIISIYGPNTDNTEFYEEVQNLLDDGNSDYTLICGDFNLVLNPDLDSYNYKHINNPRARQMVLNMMSEFDLCDVFRQFNPDRRRYTWRRKNPVKQARLDFFLASTNMVDVIKNCDISLSYRSDHSIQKLDIILNNFKRGKGLWKFNNSLLENKDFLTLINHIINEEKLKYALPVYDLKYLERSYSPISMTIEPDTFLELLFLRIRGETIKFASTLKKKQRNIEMNLITDIQALESQANSVNSELLLDKKAELEHLRNIKLKGQSVRARLQWLQEGEKPTKYFCNLENKNYIEKTIRKLQLRDGSIVTEQEKILDNIRAFYENLFKNRDEKLLDIDFKKMGLEQRTPLEEMGNLLTVEELGRVLKKMKPNKTPGIDGITSEFMKVFWGKLKYFVTDAINCGFQKGSLSTSLRQCIITCLPKPNKDRSFIKNWRPISLLCVVYKLASGVIADRLKPSLDLVISKCQTGFLKGRQISDSTRLVYDLLHVTESKDIPGLLMLIDFEKAFDSVSWDFLYKALSLFGYSKNLITWIKVLNKNIKAYVLQCGVLSGEIPINRGCRQGDPVSPYLFLIGAEILSLLIRLNPHIVGILIDGIEFKLTQFADDTTLMLDGSQHSLQAALNTLEIFGNMSGLRMNKDKTKMIWIGRKRFCRDKLYATANLKWDDTDFTMLGLKFSTHLSKIPEMNYHPILQNIKQDVKKWSGRYLTPFGRITVAKTSILSKCIHIFSSLPISLHFQKQLNNILFQFVWDKKPDKIKRTTICNSYCNGGLKMINVNSFEKALKVSWIGKFLSSSDSQWFSLFKISYGNPDKVLSFGDEFSSLLLKNITNPFWHNVLNIWAEINYQTQIRTNDEILQTCIWYNSHIFKTPTFFPDWFKKGIYLIGDITERDGQILKLEDLNKKFNANLNFLNYYTVCQSVKNFISKHKQSSESWIFESPTYPLHLKYLLDTKKPCKIFYSILNKTVVKETPLCQIVWNELLLSKYSNNELTDKWLMIYKVCFKTVEDNELIWFQYRILYKILGTKEYLKRTKLSLESECNLCKDGIQDVKHLFVECPAVAQLWENLGKWIHNKLGLFFTIDETMRLFGYLKYDSHFWPLNFLLLITRKYIFWCTTKQYPPDIYFLQKELKRKYIEQELLHKTKSKSFAFQKKWALWDNIFNINDVST